MCDNAEDMDEFIVYEVTKEEAEDDQEYEDTEVIELAEEEEEELDAEPEYILASTVVAVRDDDDDQENYDDSQIVGLQLPDEPKYETDDVQQLDEEYQQLDALIEEEEEEEAVDEDDDEAIEQLQYEAEDDDAPDMMHELIEAKPMGNPKQKGPKRYLLFDDLIATIVDYDVDYTPIVEFSMSGCEADEKLPVECGICPDVMHKSKLAKHLKTHLSTTANRYKCIYCEETYKDYKYLAGHARRHMGIRPYVCEPCKLYFSTKQDLRVHNQRRHQVKEHICEVCGKTFAQNTQLKRHRESTHEKKRRFACGHCPKAYYKNFALQEHIRAVHEGNRRMLVCPFCGMQCRDAHKMARHRKELHLNQSHYECQICQEGFTDISYFDAHKRSIQCRNNTRRKLEEEEQQAQQQMEEHVVYEITLDSNEPN